MHALLITVLIFLISYLLKLVCPENFDSFYEIVAFCRVWKEKFNIEYAELDVSSSWNLSKSFFCVTVLLYLIIVSAYNSSVKLSSSILEELRWKEGP